MALAIIVALLNRGAASDIDASMDYDDMVCI